MWSPWTMTYILKLPFLKEQTWKVENLAVKYDKFGLEISEEMLKIQIYEGICSPKPKLNGKRVPLKLKLQTKKIITH